MRVKEAMVMGAGRAGERKERKKEKKRGKKRKGRGKKEEGGGGRTDPRNQKNGGGRLQGAGGWETKLPGQD